MTRRSAARPDYWGSLAMIIGLIALLIVSIFHGELWGIAALLFTGVLGSIGRSLQLRGYAVACFDDGGDEYVRCNIGFHSYSYTENECTRCGATIEEIHSVGKPE